MGALVATVSVALYDSVVIGCVDATDTEVGAVVSAALESLPAQTPTPITAASTAPAAPTGTHLAASLCLCEADARFREPDERGLLL
jgi:hypothetical protein